MTRFDRFLACAHDGDHLLYSAEEALAWMNAGATVFRINPERVRPIDLQIEDYQRRASPDGSEPR